MCDVYNKIYIGLCMTDTSELIIIIIIIIIIIVVACRIFFLISFC